MDASAGFVAEGAQLSAKLGIQLFTRTAKDFKDIPPALDEIFGKVEAFWLLQDATLLRPELLAKLLLLQLSKKVGILTFSSTLVKKGALAAFYFEFEDQGR